MADAISDYFTNGDKANALSKWKYRYCTRKLTNRNEVGKMMRVSGNWIEYVITYPYFDEPDYDGVHNGGIKGIRDDAPEEVKAAFEIDMKRIKDAERRGVKL